MRAYHFFNLRPGTEPRVHSSLPGAPFMRGTSRDFLFSLFHLLVRVDAVGGDFDFGNAAEGEQKLYEVLGRLLRSLFYNVGNRVGDGGLEHHALGLQAGKVHTHELSGLQHDLQCFSNLDSQDLVFNTFVKAEKAARLNRSRSSHTLFAVTARDSTFPAKQHSGTSLPSRPST